MFSQFLELPRVLKRILSVASDCLALGLAMWGSFSLHAEQPFLPNGGGHLTLYALTVGFTVLTFIRLGLYRAVVRFLSDRAMLTISGGALISVVWLLLFGAVLEVPLPGAVVIMYGTLAFLFVGGTRLGVRMLINHPGHRNKQPVGIVGVGETGRQLASALAHGTEHRPAAFFTLEPAAHLSLISAVPVYSIDHAEKVIRQQNLKRILLALDDNSAAERREVLAQLEPLSIPVQVVPSVSSLVAGRVRVSDIRDLDVEDLLGRPAVPVDQALLSEGLQGKSVLVTGAGGSIGSELCRQIIRQQPRTLVLFEQSEFGLYNIERELQALNVHENLEVTLYPVLGSVLHRRRCASVMQTCGVQVVYHAAAYKHVPLVEQNIIEGVQNNVFGTWHAAEAAIDAGVERFVLISTDKAVRPVNVMGASKRLAELVLQGLAQRETGTVFTMVRFGNVLGSSGSVVPLFRDQIREGGPVTVTHPKITRYFMTIPEAAQLVLQAGTMARGGEVFVLDMGEPVKIADLARKMIHLMGLSERNGDQPDGDIQVVYTGLRPGEKLFEELMLGTDPQGTRHPRIMMAREHSLPWAEIEDLLTQLKDASHRFDYRRVVALLAASALEYVPEEHPLDALATEDAQVSEAGIVAMPSNIRQLNPGRDGTRGV
jgi:FlaA1/EpsC-like NDP-sugar epimerase